MDFPCFLLSGKINDLSLATHLDLTKVEKLFVTIFPGYNVAYATL